MEARGKLTITNSTVSANTAGGPGLGAGEGGAILNQGVASLTNDTISDNSAASDMSAGFGGGIFTLDAAATTTIVNSTIADNHAGGGGSSAGCGGNLLTSQTCAGGPDGKFSLKNTIVSGGTGTPGQDNCAGRGYTSQGHNLDATNECMLKGPGDRVKADPQLGPLADNGGSHSDAGPGDREPGCQRADNSGCPAADQRGVLRPQAGTCDIGAFELVFPSNPPSALVAVPQITLPASPPQTVSIRSKVVIGHRFLVRVLASGRERVRLVCPLTARQGCAGKLQLLSRFGNSRDLNYALASGQSHTYQLRLSRKLLRYVTKHRAR